MSNVLDVFFGGLLVVLVVIVGYLAYFRSKSSSGSNKKDKQEPPKKPPTPPKSSHDHGSQNWTALIWTILVLMAIVVLLMLIVHLVRSTPPSLPVLRQVPVTRTIITTTTTTTVAPKKKEATFNCPLQSAYDPIPLTDGGPMPDWICVPDGYQAAYTFTADTGAIPPTIGMQCSSAVEKPSADAQYLDCAPNGSNSVARWFRPYIDQHQAEAGTFSYSFRPV